jgi:nicotinamidase-related amidase
MSGRRKRHQTGGTTLFAESDYYDPTIVQRWSDIVQAKRLRQGTKLFSMFGEDYVVDFGADVTCVIMTGMQNRFVDLTTKIAGDMMSILDACLYRGFPIFLTQHWDPAVSKFPYRGERNALGRFWAQSQRLPYAYSICRESRDWELLPHLQEVIDGAGGLSEGFLIPKTSGSGFQDTPLLARMRYLGVGSVILCGTMSNVEHVAMARTLKELGYHVVYLKDGSCAVEDKLHKATLAAFEEWSVTRTLPVEDVLKAIKKKPPNQTIMTYMQEGWPRDAP